MHKTYTEVSCIKFVDLFVPISEKCTDDCLHTVPGVGSTRSALNLCSVTLYQVCQIVDGSCQLYNLVVESQSLVHFEKIYEHCENC